MVNRNHLGRGNLALVVLAAVPILVWAAGCGSTSNNAPDAGRARVTRATARAVRAQAAPVATRVREARLLVSRVRAAPVATRVRKARSLVSRVRAARVVASRVPGYPAAVVLPARVVAPALVAGAVRARVVWAAPVAPGARRDRVAAGGCARRAAAAASSIWRRDADPLRCRLA